MEDLMIGLRANQHSRIRERKSLRIAYVVGGFYTEASGIARSVASLANELTTLGHHVTLFVPQYAGKPTARHLLSEAVELISPPGLWCARLGISPRLNRLVKCHLSTYDVVHTHSLWMLPTHYATKWAHAYGVPLVASTQGFLDTWALSRRRLRKFLASLAFQKSDLRKASVIHAVTEREVGQIVSFVGTTRIAVIPNGVPDEILHAQPELGATFRRDYGLTSRRILLFMSRLHVKKGVDLLLEAWRHLSSQFPDWILVIAGPDDGFERSIRQYIERFQMQHSTRLLPPLYGREKIASLAAADVFVLPSRSEGLPMALLEAMGAGKPIVYTKTCYFPEAAMNGAAIEVECTVEHILAGLRTILSLDRNALFEMGQRGRQLIQREFTWKKIASRFEELYCWLAHQADTIAPAFVRTSVKK